MKNGDLFLGRYLIQDLVGRGTISVVYKASDTKRGNNTVAIKLLDTNQPNAYTQEHFRRETTSLRRLNHPGIVQLLDNGYDEKEGAFYLVLEYLPKTFSDVVNEHVVGDTTWLWPIIKNIAEALLEAHSEGVIHRDIKPSNVLFDEAIIPKLADFGISKLKFDVCIGVTLSAFLSPGYSAPEQRRGEEADTWSDIYSLGAIIYYAIAHSAPSASGPSHDDIASLQVSQPIKTLLSRLTAEQPTERLRNMQEVLRELETCSLPTILPTALLIVTDSAINDLMKINAIPNTDFSTVHEFLLETLGGPNVEELPVLLGPDGKVVEILSGQYEFRCIPNTDTSALVLTSVSIPWQPTMEKRSESAFQTRIIWEPISQSSYWQEGITAKRESANCITSLLGDLTTHNKQQSIEANWRGKRKDFSELWERFLILERSTVEKKSPQLAYKNFKIDDDLLVFTLMEPFPDDLNWPYGTPIAVSIEGHYFQPLGRLENIKASEVSITLDRSGLFSKHITRRISKKGKITLSLGESLSVIKRLQFALGLFRTRSMANRFMSDIIVEPKRARINPTPTISKFFHDFLAKDKKSAVLGALSAADLFLIQGPPGSGKTTVIAELIAQIRTIEPNSRILVTSQSNVPVNHALSRVEKIKDKPPTEMLRVGRAENIGKGAEKWEVETQLHDFRVKVETNCDQTIQTLRDQLKTSKQTSIPDPIANSKTNDVEVLQEWLNEAKSILEELREYEIEAVGIKRKIEGPDGSQSDKNTLDSLIQIITGTREELRNHLSTITDLLPEQFRPKGASNLEDQYKDLQAAYLKYQRESIPEARELKLIALIKEWKTVVGNAADFQDFLLKKAHVVGATCLFSAGGKLADDIFDWVIVDEAGRATAPELLAAIVRARRVVLVGDEKQLPPFVDQELTDAEIKEAGLEPDVRTALEKSLFEVLVEKAAEERPEILIMLQSQHRMHPVIGSLISEVFYDNKLINGTTADKLTHGIDWIKYPIMWYSTSSNPKRRETHRGSSFCNVLEVDAIKTLLSRLETSCRASGVQRSVGVISGYDAQIQELVTRISPDDQEQWKALNIEIDTVDGFQGRECDILLYSTVRSNAEGRIGFLKDRRRINVALSRSRQLLIIVGDLIMMENANISRVSNPFSGVVSYIRNHQHECGIEIWEAK